MIPYRSDDLYRPKDEGRSLHDDASHFYCSAMGLATPLQEFPTPEDIHRSIAFIFQHPTDMRSREIVTTLRSTDATNLWPDGDPPATSVGLLWKVSNAHIFDQWKQKHWKDDVIVQKKITTITVNELESAVEEKKCFSLKVRW